MNYLKLRTSKAWLIALAFLFSGLLLGDRPAAKAYTVDEVVDMTAQYLIAIWRDNKTLKTIYPPQILPISSNAKVYGACGKLVTGEEVAGSSYCSSSHTIYLVPEQLESLSRVFGPSAIAYAIAHEFGHALQAVYRIKLSGPSRELQADCLAGFVIGSGSKQLGVTREDVINMGRAAYAIGDASHGTGAQRSYALLSGMGVFKSTCKESDITALANGTLRDPALLKLSSTRSGNAGVDSSKTPYPKTLKTALGI